MATSAASTYDQLCAEHEWRVPERYNIAQDVCDKHPRDKPAMIWERYDGARRDLTWGELQDLSNQAANWLASHGVTRGDRVAVVLPPTPETAAVFFATWKLGAILLSMSVLYGDDGIRHRLTDSQAEGARHRRAERAALRPRVGRGGARPRRRHAARPVDRLRDRGHVGRGPGPALLHVRHDRASRRASSTPTATSSPTRSSSTATTSRTARSSTAWASGPGPRASPRCSARGATARCSASSSARAASTRPSSSTSSAATRSRTSSRPRPRCGR